MQNKNYPAETALIFEFYIILFLTTDLHQTQVWSFIFSCLYVSFPKTEFPKYTKRMHIERDITDPNVHFQISRNERTRNHFCSFCLLRNCFLHSHVFATQILIACSFLYDSNKNVNTRNKCRSPASRK